MAAREARRTGRLLRPLLASAHTRVDTRRHEDYPDGLFRRPLVRTAAARDISDVARARAVITRAAADAERCADDRLTFIRRDHRRANSRVGAWSRCGRAGKRRG